MFDWTGLEIDRSASSTMAAPTNTVSYVECFLSLCTLEWLRTDILEGFVTLAGGEYEDQIRVSRTALVNHTSHLSNFDLQCLCVYLIRILRTRPDNDRILIPAMEVVNFLFEAGITWRLEQEGFGYVSIFHIKTPSFS